ncbi:ATP-dependent helicase [Pseudorhodobacter sp. E13]|uniref:UvrD-helicase domain-containing protein n=1 Tax=Pseudorhodobacter sp. E13 TaxID=2487931 RepID=UPI000F8F63C6|nr:UvrD-helicase domain-containing protein [Pseudorhodobacter sp. E13]RUS65282.1 ATP-dependent helicase [Pseudorhodobacter sp. E13]
MSDQSVFDLLRSDERLVVVEAPAGCGKTFQGAAYAHDIAPTLKRGRMLILTHTNAACDVFAERTKGLIGKKVEIRTIDAMISQIASAYHQALGLPADLSVWAYANNGFPLLASKVAELLAANPMISVALGRRYPVIVCDEHQDASPDHHAIIMSLFAGGAKLRIFGDRMQSIYERHPRAAALHRERWENLVNQSVHDELDTPHRWQREAEGCSELGSWVLEARERLLADGIIDLTRALPPTVQVIFSDNIARNRGGYLAVRNDRQPIDRCLDRSNQMFVLASNNALVQSLRAFWRRRVPIWEGHTRNALSKLVADIQVATGNASEVANCLILFMEAVGVGFTEASHGRTLKSEIQNGCKKVRTGKPGSIQVLAKFLTDQPSHVGLARAIAKIGTFIDNRAPGFADVKIDQHREFWESQRLSEFEDPAKAYAEISMKRTILRPKPRPKSLATVHKAKGLECDNVMIMHCDRASFGDTVYGRCKLYVALSRAKSSVTLVIPRTDHSPLFRVRQ